MQIKRGESFKKVLLVWLSLGRILSLLMFFVIGQS